MSPLGCQKMSAKPCNRNAEESFPVLSLKSREQKPPNPLLIQDKDVLQPSIDVSASAPGIERRRVVWTCAAGGGRVRLANVPRGKGLGKGSSRAEGKRYTRAIAH